MKKLTKILSILLAVALAVTGFVLAVSADDAEPGKASYTVNGESATGTLAEALSAADDKTTVKLEGDCTLEETFTVTKNLTVDLNGYTLDAKADAFVIGANNVQFKIVGTGSINLAGKLVSAAQEFKGFEVTVAGNENSTGIAISHSASNITYTYHGTWNFKNLKVVSTSNLQRADSYFKTETNNSATANLNFDGVSFDSTSVSYKSSTGNFVVSISGEGNLKVYNSAFRTQNSGIYAANEYGIEGSATGMVDIKNSTISCIANNTLNGRNYVFLGMNYNLDKTSDQKAGFAGMVNVENSLVECNLRLFCIATYAEASVAFTNSTMRIVGARGTDTAHSFVRGDNTTVTIRSGCRFLSASSPITAAPVGTRSNLESLLADAISSDDMIVYDPVGDPDAPFVVVSKASAVSSPDWFKNYGFDTIRIEKDTGGNHDLKLKTADTTWKHKDPYKFTSATTGMQWDNKYGIITHILGEGSAYVKYWVDGEPGTKVNLSSSVGTDTYYIMGVSRDGDYTNTSENADLRFYPTSVKGANRKSVMVAEFDFATEEGGVGYPAFNVEAQARYTDGKDSPGAAGFGKAFKIDNAGNIVDTGNLKDKPAVMPTLNPAGEWNRMSMVCYSDPVNSKYCVYVYMNGEYMGWIELTKTAGGDVFFQGIRCSFGTGNQTVGSNMLIDNVSFRAYTDYQFAGEKDSDYDEATATYANNGVYYPEKYIHAKPAATYVEPSVTVGGIAFDDVNEALAFATEKNTVVDIHRDIKAEITANGLINTNGYNLEAIGNSYGYVALGNLVEFNANYQYEAWFYTGSLDKTEFADSDFEKVIVKIGDEVDRDYIYTDYNNKIFADKTLAGGQSGWAYVKGATESVLPKIADKSDIEKAENGVIKYFPVMGAIPMTYYVNYANGTTYAGDVKNEQALVDFRALKDGDTFVLQSDINISETENTFVNKGTINIDLNGNTLSLSKAGRFVVIGSNTTLNVYSSKAGGTVNCVTYSGSAKGNQAFVIDDPAVTSFTSPELANNVTNAAINLGGNGVKMTVVAEIALKGRVGDDSCRITSDGVDFIAPDNTINRAIFDAQLFNGEIYVKNSFILAINKFNIVNIDGFYKTEDTKDENGKKISTAHKPDKDSTGAEIELSNRQPGFENTVMTGYMELENCIIVNRLSGLNNDSVKDNILANNGDGSNVRKNLKFKNVVATGRFNPSNSGRTIFEGFVAVEHYDMGNSVKLVNDTVKANYTRPMTLDMIDLGINTVDGIYNCAIKYYDAESGEMVTANEYKIANGGVTAGGVYTLPKLKGATAYSSDVFTVAYKNTIVDKDSLATEKFVKGSMFILKSDVVADTYTGKLVTMTPTSDWTYVPEYVTENVTLVPAGYVTTASITGIMADISLYSDFDVNLYIPAEYMDVITIAEAYTLTDATINGKAYKKITVTQACNKITENITVTINICETVFVGEYTDTREINYSVAKYAETALASETMDDNTKTLVYYMLNYANESAKYLNGAADEKLTAMIEANKTLAEMNPHTPGSDPLVTEDAVAKLGSVFTQATLTLDPKPAYVFTVNDGFVGTVTIANGTNVRTYNFTENTDRTIVIDGMKAYSFVATLVITANGTVNGETVTLTDGVYSLSAFAEYHANNSENADSAACLPLVNAFRIYADFAYYYKMGVWAW